MLLRRLSSSLLLLALASSAGAQEARFDGWDRVGEAGYSFDPDERQILGFSVRASTNARGLMAKVEQAFQDGDALVAGRLLLELQRDHPTHVLQVAGASGSASRWVGAAEWAAYMLAHRIPAGTRALLASPEQKAVLEHAVAWRDEALLRRLAIELEALPEGERAASVLGDLLREAGQDIEAALVERGELPSESPRESIELPVGPDRMWSTQLSIGRLADESRAGFNPFAQDPRGYEANFAPIRPVLVDGIAFVADSISVRAVDLISGRDHWVAPGPLEREHDGEAPGEHFPFRVYADPKRPRAINPYQIAQPAVSEEAVFATVQVGEDTYPLDSFDGFPINHPLPSRRLHAFDRDSGQLLWRQEREDLSDEAFENRFDPVGPPVLVGERVWVSGAVREGALSAWVASFDRRTGELLSRTLLCTGQQELTMFNRPFHEHIVSPPRFVDGAIYVSTNLGVVGSVDALTGRTRWITRYEVIEREAAVRIRANLRDVHWTNEAPWVVDGVLLVAPLDSRYLLAMDASTGRYRYVISASAGSSRQMRTPVRHQVVPVDDERFVLLTRSGLECRETRTGAPVWPLRELRPDTEIVGRAVRYGDQLLVPCRRELLVVDLIDGQLVDVLEWPFFGGSRDLQVVEATDGVLTVTDGAQFHGLLDSAPLARRLRRASGAGDREAARQLAELDLLGGRYDDAVEAYASLRETSSDAGWVARVESGLLEAALRRARASERPEDWRFALDAMRSPDDLLLHAEELLGALERSGQLESVVRALDELAELDPQLTLALGEESAQPISVLRARYGLPLLAPAAQMELLQQLVAEDAPGEWGGVRVAERARRLQGELIEKEGRELYADYERRAGDLFDEGRTLREVARLFPHALAVADARRAQLREALDAGRPQEVLARTVGAVDTELLGLRLEAAAALLEDGYARLLRGEIEAVPTALGRLPSPANSTRQFQMHPLNRVSFRELTGRPDPDLAGYAPGFISGSGELFALDTRRGEVAWEGRALPEGRLTLVNDASFHREGELLIVRGGSTIEAMQLVDGAPRWSVDLGGYGAKVVRSLAGGGLFLSLRELSGERMELVALGLATGSEVFRLPLDGVTDASMSRAGSSLVLNVLGVLDRDRDARERRLLVVDLRSGAVMHEESLDGDLIMAGATHVPERVLFAGRDGAGSRLLGFDPQSKRWLWSSSSSASFIGSSSLLEDGKGGYVLAVPVNLEEPRLRPHRITPVDLDHGLVEPAGPPRLELVLGHDAVAAPRLLMRDPAFDESFQILDSSTGAAQGELRFLPGELEGGVRVRHAADGFVLMAQTWDVPMRTSMWVVTGPGRDARYSVDVSEMGRRHRPGLLLVDGALLVAAGNTVSVVRGRESER